ncbi:MAG: NAD(P)/FAD-dependent oxidoreductase [Pseudomonadales bacterium]|jgi:4-hydroxyacetophenone monooxygenase|nr:NAD(P)/FAD-dependent oxidoreductase [Pseudomonadales bacterium]
MTMMDITATDEEIKAALLDVNLPTLLMVLTEFAGDDRWLTERYKPEPIHTPEGELFPDDSGGYSEEIAQEIRQAALELAIKLRDEGAEMPPVPDLQRLKTMMEFSTAEPVDDNFSAMLLEETNFVDRDQDWLPGIEKAGVKDDFHVVVVGAGMSGICTAAKLNKAGISYTVLEKNDAVGGTWYENTYPDCGVDTPNHFYSFSFARNANWTGYFSKRDELYQYFEHCTDEFGIRDNIRLKAEVRSMQFDQSSNLWTVTYVEDGGEEQTLQANVVVSAVGQLNRPVIPEFEGLECFNGRAFHSARWEHDVDLEGKRVAVIGTGCSAVQLVPKTADRAEHLTVFQRSPHWISPNRDYYRPVEEGIKWALNCLPRYAEWHRARMIFGFMDRNWDAVPGDPEWQDKKHAMNETNDGVRQALIAYMSDQLGDRQELMAKCVPDFPPFGKRVIIDNNWYGTIAREDVSLVDSPIVRFTETGIETEDGTSHEFDVVIFATGFNTNRFLWPMEVVGESGESLDSRWGESPEAYKGMLVPDYPNLFCLYGPNTNIVHGGSIIYNTEVQVHYVMQCLELMLNKDASRLEIPQEACDTYNNEVQEISRNLAWGHPGVESWYKNSEGRVVNNSPFSNLEYWVRMHEAEPELYRMN